MKLPSEFLREVRALSRPEEERILLERFPSFAHRKMVERKWPVRMPCNARPFILFIGISSGNSPACEDKPVVSSESCSSSGHLCFGEDHENFHHADTRKFFQKLRELSGMVQKIAEPAFPPENYLHVTGLINLGLEHDGEATPSSTDGGIIEWVSSVTERMSPPVIVGVGLKGVFADNENVQAWAAGGSQFTWQPPWESEMPINDKGNYRLRWKRVRYSNGAVGNVYLLPNHTSRFPLSSRSGWDETKEKFCAHFGSLIFDRDRFH